MLKRLEKVEIWFQCADPIYPHGWIDIREFVLAMDNFSSACSHLVVCGVDNRWPWPYRAQTPRVIQNVRRLTLGDVGPIQCAACLALVPMCQDLELFFTHRTGINVTLVALTETADSSPVLVPGLQNLSLDFSRFRFRRMREFVLKRTTGCSPGLRKLSFTKRTLYNFHEPLLAELRALIHISGWEAPHPPAHWDDENYWSDGL